MAQGDPVVIDVPAPAAPVVVESGSKTSKTIAGTITLASGQMVASPTTTEEEERVSQGQRNVNMIWESTQMRIALSVVGTVMLACLLVVVGIMFVLVSRWSTLDAATIAVLVTVLTSALGSLTSMGSLVIGFYFGRTNHQKIGGVEQGR